MQGPVIAIALILAAVFIPVAFMGGITGRLYQQFALTIAISVLISAFNALTLSPALSALLLRPRSETRGAARAARRRVQPRLRRARPTATSAINRVPRSASSSIPLVLLAGVVGRRRRCSGAQLPSGFVPDEDQGYAIIGVQLPDGASLQRTEAVLREDRRVLAQEPGIACYNGVAGFSLFTRTAASYTGTGVHRLQAVGRTRAAGSAARRRSSRASTASFRSIPAGARLRRRAARDPGHQRDGRLQPDAAGPQRRRVRVPGAERRQVRRGGAQAARARRACGRNFSPAVPQLFADVDKEKALKQGVALTDIYSTLQTFLGGSYVNDFTRFGRQWRVFVQAEADYRTHARGRSASSTSATSAARWCRCRRS